VVPEQQNFANNKQFDKEEVEQMQKMLFLWLWWDGWTFVSLMPSHAILLV
jgi:hypothetical protein